MSLRKLLHAKIHRLTVTGANVEYEGSFTIPPDLMEAAAIVPYEAIQVWNVTRGTRLETYAIRGDVGSRDVCANGAAAHLIQPGDQVILASYTFVAAGDIVGHQPRLVFVDSQNRITHTGPEIPGPHRRSATSIVS